MVSEREHEHEHEHSHSAVVEYRWATATIEAHVHDQAATVSMSINPRRGFQMTFSDLVGGMRAIAQAAEKSGGIVGHIKAFARRGEHSAHASVTSADLDPMCEGDQLLAIDPLADVQLAAIVLLIDRADLVAICESALGEAVSNGPEGSKAPAKC